MKPARSPSGTPAPYGHACQSCAHAKCKCMLLESGNGCERCQRLGKDCRPSQTIRRRNQRSSGSNFATLEAKVDYVLTAYSDLQNAAIPGPSDQEATYLPRKQRGGAYQSIPGNAGNSTSLPSLSTSEDANYPLHPVAAYNQIMSLLYVPPAMAQKYLDQFRTHNVQYLPFVYIPPDMTSDQLREKCPFFWVCIMEVVTTQNPEKGDSFGRITHYISQRVMVDAVASMDLLLGIMTFISWVTYSKRPFLNAYAHILMGVVADLGINKSPSRDNSSVQEYKSAIGAKGSESVARTLEERRAVLGCFVISSCTALSMARIDAMRWTPHMEESLLVLAEAGECPEDEILVALVKIHLVLDRSYHLRRDGHLIESPAFYINAFRMQLDAVKQEIPTYLQEHIIKMYLFNAEITINEISIGPSAVPHSPHLERLESLLASLKATKSWLDIWQGLKAEEYFQVSCIVFFQWIRAIVNLYKLTILEDPAWSKLVVQETADVLDYLSKTIAAIKCYPEYLKFEEGREMNLLEKGLRMTEALKYQWELKLGSILGSSMLPRDESDSMIQPDDIPPSGMAMPAFEDSWIMEFMGSL